MKNYSSHFNPFIGAGILGFAVPAAVYLIGFIALLVFVLAVLLLLPFYMGNILDSNLFMNITAVIATVLQAAAIVILTLVLGVFARMKLGHVFLSIGISTGLFFLVERFFKQIRWSNFPEVAVFFPKLFEGCDKLTNTEFVSTGMYVKTALFLSGACAVIVLITRAIAGKKLTADN